MTKLGDIAGITLGVAPPSSSYNTEGRGLPLVQGSLDMGLEHPMIRTWTTEPVRTVQSGTILMSLRAPAGKVNMADAECSIGRGVAGITVDAEKAVPGYVFHYLESHTDMIQDRSRRFMTGALTQNDLVDLPLELPDEAVQLGAVPKLEVLMRMRSILEKMESNMELMRRRVFRDMFGDPRVDTQDRGVMRLGELARFQRGCELPENDRGDGEIPVCGAKQVVGRCTSSLVQGPCVITGRTGTIGMAYCIDGPSWPLNTVLYSQNLDGTDPLYLTQLLRELDLKRFVKSSVIACIDRKTLEDLEVPIVDRKEQERYGEVCRRLDANLQAMHGFYGGIQRMKMAVLNQGVSSS